METNNQVKTFSWVEIDISRAKSNSNVVKLCAERLGMRVCASDAEFSSYVRHCKIYWHNVVYPDIKNVVRCAPKNDVFVNKFPGMTEITNKISLTNAIRSMAKILADEYQFYPKSWVLPAQQNEFLCHSTEERSMCYIVKPNHGAQGNGIYLIRSVYELKPSEECQLVQEYIDDPFLFSDRRKFDLRVYALLKSINPLSIFVAREGMARFCTEKYVRPKKENFDRLLAHLTNYSLNKTSEAYIHSNSIKDQFTVKTLIAMIPEIMLHFEHHFSDMPSATPNCFQILGFDILVKQDGTPILLEVNSSPSLSLEHSFDVCSEEPIIPAPLPPIRSIVDEMVKIPLVQECLSLIVSESARTIECDESSTSNKSFGSEKNCTRKNVLRQFSINADAAVNLALVSKRRKRPHLIELFPGGRRFDDVKHLLVLDRVVYLFLQFVPIKRTTQISPQGLKNFLRKCSLTELLKQLDSCLAVGIGSSTTGKKQNWSEEPIANIPFHMFLQLLLQLSQIKYPEAENTKSALSLLLADCDSSLRKFGVTSRRLRRSEKVINRESELQVFLLPERFGCGNKTKVNNLPFKSKWRKA